MLLLRFVVSDACLDMGGRVGRTWAECETYAGEIASWRDYVGIVPIFLGILVWLLAWTTSYKLISNAFSRNK